MARAEAVKTGPDNAEFDTNVNRTFAILRESVRVLIQQHGGVMLRTDSFAGKIDVIPSNGGIRDIELLMTELRFSIKQVFLDGRTPFSVTAAEKIVSIKKSSQHVDAFQYQVIPRRIDDKGRITIGRPEFLKEAALIKKYSKMQDGKLYVVLSGMDGLDLHEHGYNQRTIGIDEHRRIVVRDVNLSQIPKGGADFRLVIRGFYAILVAGDGGDSQFASIDDYEKNLIPLLE